MTDDTAKKNVVGLRRVLRAKAEEQARGVVTTNPPMVETSDGALVAFPDEGEPDWSKASPEARAEARAAFSASPTRIGKKAFHDAVIAAAEAAGAKIVRLTNIKDHPDIVMMSPPNSAEARAAFAAAPNTGPSAAELWARGRPLGQPYQPPTTAEVVNGGLAQAIARYERTPRGAFDVFLACCEEETVYDFSSETTMKGESFVITTTATPRRGGPAPAEGG